MQGVSACASLVLPFRGFRGANGPPFRNSPRSARFRASRALSGRDGTQAEAPGWELPGGVWWKTAPGVSGPLLDFSSAVTSHGDGFVMLGPVKERRSDKASEGVRKLDSAQSQSLVLASVKGDAQCLALSQVAADPVEVVLVPIEPGEAELVDSSDLISSSECQGIVLSAATGRSAMTSLAAPSAAPVRDGDTLEQVTPSKSPRRTQPVKFTCNICKTKTIRVVNPHAWAKGTVFLECSGCGIKHKVKDNLKLFHELSGPVFPQGLKRPEGIQDRPLSWRLEDLGGGSEADEHTG